MTAQDLLATVAAVAAEAKPPAPADKTTEAREVINATAAKMLLLRIKQRD